MSHLRVLIADGDSRVRRCLRTLIDQQPDMAVIGEVSGGGDLLDAAAALKPDRILVDVQIGGNSSLDVIRSLKANESAASVVVLSVYADQLADALRAGASHYLLKGCPVEDLLRALRKPCCERPRLKGTMDSLHNGSVPDSAQGASQGSATQRANPVNLQTLQGAK